jgi:amino acid adenylation domain-containing protein
VRRAFEIKPVAREGNLPLSYAQQRLWFMDRMDPGSSTYNMPGSFRLIGELDIEALKKSLETIIARHEVLRTRFPVEDGEAVQVIDEPFELQIPIKDLTDLPETERAIEARRLATGEAETGFDLAEGPLLRSRLLKLREDEHVILLTMHHIVSDAWSMGILIREFTTLYLAYAQGKDYRMPDLPIQYADYAVWQRGYLEGDELERHLGYWRDRLTPLPAVLDLPADHSRPHIQTFNGGQNKFEITEEIGKQVESLSTETDTTIFMVLLAGYMTLLSRYTGEKDISVGIPTANRSRAETEGLIGFFVNMLAMRGDLSGDPTFRELLDLTREMTLGAFNHQVLPFEMMVKDLQPERDTSRNPIFQVAFQYQNIVVGELHLPGLRLEEMETDFGTAKLDLMLSMSAGKDGKIKGAFRYNKDIFEAATIERMGICFQRMISALVANPDLPISGVPMLTAPERKALITTWNETEATYPQNRHIQELFEHQVLLTPDVEAVRLNGASLSYTQLNERANQLARYLVAAGVEADTVVGLCVERSVEMFGGLLGILKAGGAYLPLDPSYPSERLAYMLEDSDTGFLITQEYLLGKIPDYDGVRICLDRDQDFLKRESSKNLDSRGNGENLAYIIYTSGTTGTPKGVQVKHRNLVNHAWSMKQRFRMAVAERMLKYISISFDAALEEIFPTLLSGGTIVMAKNPSELVGTSLLEYIDDQEVNYLHLPVSVWHQTVAEMERLGLKAPASLKLVLVGGERVELDRLRTWSKLVDQPVRFLNAYGPTETTITATVYETLCYPNAVLPEERVPIGKPIANVHVYVLDEHHEPVPIGVTGELFIGGAGVSAGYLNRPEQNDTAFVPNPFGKNGYQNMYRTGDQVRYLPDGNLVFLGRADDQVKLRGYRIELGEIEVALREYPHILDAVVLLREDSPGIKQLVAYPVRKGSGEFKMRELETHLKSRLPGYMVPGGYVWMDELPLTLNGKIDRESLPVPDIDTMVEFVPPRSPLESRLVDMWKELLGVEEISVMANFFDLGGNSLLGATFINRLQADLGEYLYLIAIFDAPTIASLARYLLDNYPVGVVRLLGQDAPEDLSTLAEIGETVDNSDNALTPYQRLKVSQQQPLVPIQPQGTKPPLFMAHSGGGIVFPYYNLIPYLGKDQPVYGLQDPSCYTEENLYASLEEMAEAYIEFIQKVQPKGPYHLAGWSFGGGLAFELAQQLKRKGEQIALLVVIDSGMKMPDWKTRRGKSAPRQKLPLGHFVKRLFKFAKTIFSTIKDVIPYLRSAFYALISRSGSTVDKKQRFSQIVDRIRGIALTTEFLKGSELAELAAQEKNLNDIEMPSSMGRVLQLVTYHQKLGQKYVPKTYPGNIILIRNSSHQDEVLSSGRNLYLGWEKYASDVELLWTPGSHSSLFTNPNVEVIADHLTKLMNPGISKEV